MQKFKKIGDVIALAEFAHRNQTDRAGLPYIEHPRRVMEAVRAQGAMPYVQMAAILHDVTEDTAFTCDMLIDLGVPGSAVQLVMLLDRDFSKAKFFNLNQGRDLSSDGKYFIALGPDAADEFYYDELNASPEARMIKLADIGDNMQPWRRSYLPVSDQERLAEKYAKAYRLLGVK